VDLRTRGSRKKWRSSGFEDGEDCRYLPEIAGCAFSLFGSMVSVFFLLIWVLGFHV